MARNKSNTAEFTLTLKENRYKGETYPQLVGSFKKGREAFLISIATDDKGNPKFYESKKGDVFIYARAVSFTSDGDRPKRRNEMR